MPCYTLHVSGGGEEREKVGERNGRGAKRLRVAEVVCDVVSRV